MDSEEQFKLMSAAIYEIRVLLSGYLGSESRGDPCVRLAAHLAYALHNQAEGVIDGKLNFDLEATHELVKEAEEIVGHKFADNGGFLKGQETT